FVASRVAARNGARLGVGRTLTKSYNDNWRHFPRNPSGRACFYAMRRYSSLIWNNQTSLLVPCLA
ncbi:hypothetical protein, partial [Stutzerimonas nitrititolerans]|uniref:hypothetical protein n=1 Tax=Stutzerimonas nitrititolerans TaxID=2482751 RepID=UPI0028A677AF